MIFHFYSCHVHVSQASNLRRHVIRRSAEGVRRLVEVDLEFAHAEVRNSDVTLVIEQEVVQLEVSARGLYRVSLCSQYLK